jgi:hypothetical protein
MTSSNLEKKANQYAKQAGIEIVSQLGYGTDGTVFETDRESAVKVVERERNYLHELQCYQRLKAKKISKLRGFSIPRLLGHDDPLMVIEMTIVTPPYLIDFGKVYIDKRPDPSWRRDFEIEGRDMFEGRWPEVRRLLGALEVHGIYYLDPKPGNIRFGDEDESDEASI